MYRTEEVAARSPLLSALIAFAVSPFLGHIVVLRLENIALRYQMAVYKHTVYRLRLFPD
jgi:hypothetical protein